MNTVLKFFLTFLLISCGQNGKKTVTHDSNSILSGLNSFRYGSTLRVQSFSLVDADNGNTITGYEEILEGTVINLSSLSKKRIAFRANLNSTNVNYVVFDFEGTSHPTYVKPFSLFVGSLSEGSHTLSAKPFIQIAGIPIPGGALTVHFKVVNATQIPTPTPSPVNPIGTPLPTPSPLPSTVVKSPEGYYVLLPSRGNNTVPLSELNNPNITGFVVRDTWANINPSKGQFDFSRINAAVKTIKASHKRWKLKIMCGIADPVWLQAEGVKYFTFKNTNIQTFHPDPTYSIPIPWDQTMLGYYDQLLKEVAIRYDADPDLDLFTIGGPTRFSLEMMLPAEVTEQPGYSNAAITNAWGTAIRSFAKYFTSTMGNIDLGNPVGSNDGIATAVAQDLTSTLGSRAALQWDSLSAKSSPTYTPVAIVKSYAAKYICGAEQVTSSQDSRYGGSFAQSMSFAKSINLQYIDIYRPDSVYVNSPY